MAHQPLLMLRSKWRISGNVLLWIPSSRVWDLPCYVSDAWHFKHVLQNVRTKEHFVFKGACFTQQWWQCGVGFNEKIKRLKFPFERERRPHRSLVHFYAWFLQPFSVLWGREHNACTFSSSLLYNRYWKSGNKGVQSAWTNHESGIEHWTLKKLG